MPRQNRVDPWGAIVAVPNRGMFMGNRGCLHQDGCLMKKWARKAWVTCLLEFKGRRRQIMSPGRYTELFFLDEATALAAGHRPCATCRRENYNHFKHVWIEANAVLIENPSIVEIDNYLHQERGTQVKKTWQTNIDVLPDGTMIAISDAAHLVLGDELLEWSPGGYHGRKRRQKNESVTLLTPQSTAAAIRAGYKPIIHPTAGL